MISVTSVSSVQYFLDLVLHMGLQVVSMVEGQRHPRQQRHGSRPAAKAAIVVLLLLAWSHTAAAVLLSKRPGNVLTMILTDCAKYQDWQTVAAAFAWRQSGQPGSVIRVANCNEKDTNNYDKHMLDYVETHMAKQVRQQLSCRSGVLGCVEIMLHASANNHLRLQLQHAGRKEGPVLCLGSQQQSEHQYRCALLARCMSRVQVVQRAGCS
jgi:hypothetical protein